MKGKPSQKALGGVIAGLLVLAAVAAYFLLIAPQRSKAAELAKEADATREQLAQRRALALQPRLTEQIRVADLFRLTKAMPDEVDMPGVILELNRIAKDTGIRFESITPLAPSALNGYQVVSLTLVFQGNFFELSDFLFRVRNLVNVRGGKLDATGRLFVVDSVSFSEGSPKFPQIQATLTVSAFVYGTATTTGAPTPPTAPAPTPPAPAPDAPAPSPPASGASAAGAS